MAEHLRSLVSSTTPQREPQISQLSTYSNTSESGGCQFS